MRGRYADCGLTVARVFDSLGAKINAFTASPRTSDESKRDDGYIVPGTGDPDGSIPQSWYSGKAKADLQKAQRESMKEREEARRLEEESRKAEEERRRKADEEEEELKRKEEEDISFVMRLS